MKSINGITPIIKSFRSRVFGSYDSSDRMYLKYNYAGILITLVSGVLLARQLGVSNRGELAFCASFISLANFMSTLNLSSGLSSVIRSPLNEYIGDSANKFWLHKKRISLFTSALFCGLIAATSVVLISVGEVQKNSNLSIYWYFICLIPSSLCSWIALTEGAMRVVGDTQYFRIARLMGLGLPGIFTIVLIMTQKASIENLLLSNMFTLLFVTSFALYKLSKCNIRSGISVSRVFATAVKGFSYNFIDFLGPWAMIIVIINLDNKNALGNYVIALSFYGLSESIFLNLEAKDHAFLGSNQIEKKNEQRNIFLANLRKIMILKLIFIPITLTIPLFYGFEYKNASFYALLLLVLGIPLAYSKYANIILQSRSLNLLPLLSQLIFLSTLLLVGFNLPNFIQNFNWILAYLAAVSLQLLFTYFVVVPSIGLSKNRCSDN